MMDWHFRAHLHFMTACVLPDSAMLLSIEHLDAKSVARFAD